jgi:hypothetical protein
VDAGGAEPDRSPQAGQESAVLRVAVQLPLRGGAAAGCRKRRGRPWKPSTPSSMAANLSAPGGPLRGGRKLASPPLLILPNCDRCIPASSLPGICATSVRRRTETQNGGSSAPRYHPPDTVACSLGRAPDPRGTG